MLMVIYVKGFEIFEPNLLTNFTFFVNETIICKFS